MNRTARVVIVTVLSAFLTGTPVQAADAPPASGITRLILLGTQGGPRGSVERAQPSNVLVVRGTPYLIDAGNGVAHQLDKAGIPFTTIRHIFITHNHDDHNADWGTLMGRAWTSGQHEPMTVHGPPGTEAMRKGFLQYFAPNAAAHYLEGAANVPPEKVILAKDIRKAGLVYQDANIRVTAAENCHYHFSPGTPGYRWQKSYALRFETPDRVIVFSGDTGPCGDALSSFARGADVLVHEAIDLAAIEAQLKSRSDGTNSGAGQIEALMNHMRTEHTTPEEVGRVAQAAGVKQVVLTHLVTGSRVDGDAEYVAAVRKAYTGSVAVAKDLMEF